jgi:hypothetical protein
MSAGAYYITHTPGRRAQAFRIGWVVSDYISEARKASMSSGLYQTPTAPPIADIASLGDIPSR